MEITKNTKQKLNNGVGLEGNTVAWHKPCAEDCVVWSSHPQPGVVLHRPLWCCGVVMWCGDVWWGVYWC